MMDDRELLNWANHVPLFDGLSETDKLAIGKAMVERTFHSGEVIVHEDDEESRTFFILVSGKVYVSVITSQGKRIILATLKRGDFFGEMSILDGAPRSASVIAGEPCRLFMLYRESLLHILERYPKITIRILIAMSRRLRQTNRHVNTLSLMSVYGRIADVLLKLGREHGERVDNMTVVENRPTHQDIADMAGTSRETVSRVLSQLQKKHLIHMDRKKMVILDEEKLYD